jgi:hypothetical protein
MSPNPQHWFTLQGEITLQKGMAISSPDNCPKKKLGA